MACDAEDCGFQMRNDEEIVTSMQEESNPVDNETDEDENNNNNESIRGPSNAIAFSALETAMEWYEQQSECCPTQLLLLKRIKDLAAKKRRCTMHNDTAKNKRLFSKIKDKNNNLCNPLKTPSAENAISATKLFAFPGKILIIEPVLPYILEEWISKNIPAKYWQNIPAKYW
ncbi:uncharacterized protein TNCV_2720761 [Trichonephila clavipes]|nr:uncharacterized protein TNCV_2720761 [Trichonephila clavipes]